MAESRALFELWWYFSRNFSLNSFPHHTDTVNLLHFFSILLCFSLSFSFTLLLFLVLILPHSEPDTREIIIDHIINIMKKHFVFICFLIFSSAIVAILFFSLDFVFDPLFLTLKFVFSIFWSDDGLFVLVLVLSTFTKKTGFPFDMFDAQTFLCFTFTTYIYIMNIWSMRKRFKRKIQTHVSIEDSMNR